jgi:hypothetical protein
MKDTFESLIKIIVQIIKILPCQIINMIHLKFTHED